MRNLNLFLLLLFVTCFQSCIMPYYQIYKVKSDKLYCEKDAIVYDDENCCVIYNLWGENGNLTFSFTNKTDKDIYIDLTRSFFIKNGLAYDYFEDKLYTKTATESFTSTENVMKSYSKYVQGSISGDIKHSLYGEMRTGSYLWNPTTIGVTVGYEGTIGLNRGNSKTKAYTSSVTERPVQYICVPARSSKIVRGFRISDYVYKECNNKDFNTPKYKSETIIYSKDNSPLKFRNRITYKIEDKDCFIDNDFYISELSNYNKRQFYTMKEITNCGNKFKTKGLQYNVSGADMFYNVTY